MKNLRMTIVQGAFFPVPPILGGSVEKLWFELGCEMASRGHSVVHISRSHSSLGKSEYIRGVLHKRVRGFNAPRSLVFLKLLDLVYSISVLRQLPQADVIISNTFWLPILAPFLPRGSGKLMVSAERMPKGQYKFYRGASAFRAPSKAVFNAIKTESPLAGSRSVLIPNPIPFVPESVPDMQSKKNIILYVGRIHPEKGILLLLKAFDLALSQGLRDWRLRIVGPSDYASGGGGIDWQQGLASKSCAKQMPVDWVGPIYDNNALQKEYSDASIFVYPSLAEIGEALPVAPLEAMAQGTVPIVSSLNCFTDYIVNEHNGMIFNHRAQNPSVELGSAILALGVDETLRNKIAANCVFARETHSPSRIAEMLEKELLRLCS